MIRRYAARVLTAILSAYVSLSLLDLYARANLPPADFRPTWPVEFRPEVGFIFSSRSIVRCTDRFEFAVEATTNSMGFLDRERPVEKPEGVVRILALGDSFVEACQLGLEEKFTTLLEQGLRGRRADRSAEVIAMGHSGMGVVGAASLYEAYGRRFDPDLVVLVFGGNDFANDSPILEAVRNGWHPFHPPRTFLLKVGGVGTFRTIPPDPGFRRHFIAEPRPPSDPWVFGWLRRHLAGAVSFAGPSGASRPNGNGPPTCAPRRET